MSSVPASVLGARAASFNSREWRFASAIAVVLAGVFVMYWPSASSLMHWWSDTGKTTYTHGYVIAALAIWMVIRRRDLLAATPWSPSITASLLVVAVGFVWLVAVRSQIEIVHQLLLPILLWLSVWAMLGVRIALQLRLPLGYLIFAIPVWDQINFLLQEATVRAVALMLQISSIPAYVDGNFVHLAAGVFEIAGGCSGIHFFIVALSLATLYGEIGRDSMKVRIQLVLLAGGLALLANWLRVFIIVVAGHLTNMQHSLIREGHYNFGWMVFAVMMVVFFLLARRFTPRAQAEAAPDDTSTGASRGAARGVGIGLAAACVLAAPSFEFLRSTQPAVLPPPDALMPRAPLGWSKVAESSAPTWNPVFAGADRIERAAYADSSGDRVQVFVASYALQGEDKELVSYGNLLIGPADGSIVSSSRATTGEVARELVIQNSAGRAIIRYYYLIGEHRTDRDIVAQVSYGLHAITGETASSVIALRVACVTDCDEARALLSEFTAAGEPGKK
jgi:exosortase A